MKNLILVTVLFLASFVLAEAQSIKVEYKGDNVEDKLAFTEIRVEKTDDGSYSMTSEIYEPDYFQVVIKVAEVKKGKYKATTSSESISMIGNNGIGFTSRDFDTIPSNKGFVEITSVKNGVVSGNFETTLMGAVGKLVVKGTFENIKLE